MKSSASNNNNKKNLTDKSKTLKHFIIKDEGNKTRNKR